MCTAVVGGSIHRTARRISAASDQTSTTPITSHGTKDRRKLLRSEVLGRVSGFSVTSQNTRRVAHFFLQSVTPSIFSSSTGCLATRDFRDAAPGFIGSHLCKKTKVCHPPPGVIPKARVFTSGPRDL